MNYLDIFKNEEELSKYITKRLKSLRESRKLTQNEMAELLHMSEQNYARIERGRYKSSLYFILTFCSKLDITIQDFFKFKHENDTELDQYMREFLINHKQSTIDFCDFINKYYDRDIK